MKVEIIATKSPKAVLVLAPLSCKQIFSKLRRPLETVDLEELPDSRERTRAPVPMALLQRQADVWEMFSNSSSLSAILDQQGLQVAAPIDPRTRRLRVSRRS